MYEIFTYGNGIMLANILNAIAAMTATADYQELVRVIFVIVTAVVAIEMVFTGTFRPTGRLFIIILALNAAILTTTNVQITDRVEPANSSTVNNVPAGIAAPLAIFTAIGNWAAGSFETIFSLPNDLRYQTNGMLFASRLVHATQDYEITDPRMAENLAEFTEGCIYYGMLAGWFTMEDVLSSGDIWAGLPATAFGNAIFVKYTNPAGVTALDGCRNVRNAIDTDWTNAIDEMASVFGQRAFPQYAEATAKARLLASIPQSYLFMANISDTAADLIRQNAMINSIRRGFTAVAGSAGATAAIQDFAIAQAEAQQRTTYQVLGALAGRTLALMSNVLESVIYGIFPIAFAMMLVALYQGRAIFMYFKMLFWIQLWPPLYAILNFVMTSHAAEATVAAASQAGGGTVLSMLTQTGMQQVNNDLSAMAGYMSWSVPLLAWYVVSNAAGFAATTFASGLGGVAQSAGSSASGSAATGNISMGNYSAYTGRMFQSNSNPTMSRGVGTITDPGTGASYTTSGGGHQTISMPQNQTPFAANLASSIKSSVSTGLTSSVSAVKNAANSFGETTQSAFAQMQRLAQSTSSGKSASTGIDNSVGSQFARDFGEMKNLAGQFGQTHNVSEGQAASLLLAASMSSDRAAIGKVAGLATGLSASGGLDYRGTSNSQEIMSAAQNFSKANNFGEKWSQVARSAEKVSASQSAQSSDSQSNDLSASLASQKSSGSSLQASLTEAQAWQKMSNQLKDAGSSGSVSAVGELVRYGNEQGHDVAQLAADSANIKGGSSSTAATQTLNNLVSGFVGQKAADLAGVQSAPSAGGVSDAHASNSAAVSARSDGLELQSHDQQEALRSEGESRGVPSASGVQVASEQAHAQGATLKGDVGNEIITGGASVSDSGSTLQTQATERTEPGNQNHVPRATGQVVKAGVDLVSDLKDVGKSVLGMESEESKDGGQQKTANHRGAWANRLD